MFNTRSNNNNLPFYKTYTLKSPKQKKKIIWRVSIVATALLFLLIRWYYKYNSPSIIMNTLSIPSKGNSLEVKLRTPSSSEAKNFKELAIARKTNLVPVGDHIPKIVHFVYGLRDPDPTLDLIHYLAIKSAHDVLKPDKIMFHYHYIPVGEYFERSRDMLELNKVPLIESVFDRPVSHYAHKADVIRLQVLEEYGGIYLDLDLISVKPVDHLLDREFVMAQEGVDGSVGLCNAMIMARPHSRFIQRWFKTYSSFNYEDWNYHSVILPGKLSLFFPQEISVLNHSTYFWPLWDSSGLRTLYLEKSYDFSANLGTHIWESAANKNLMKDVNEQVIMEIDNSLYCQLRPILLDGRVDPRPGSCEILSHSKRSDALVGHWPLKEPLSIKRKQTNPLPAEDKSGNNLAGLIRNGRYHKEEKDMSGIYLNGDTSYIFLNVPTETSAKTLTVSWWMKTSSKSKEGQMAMVIQTDYGRVCVTTNMIQNGGLSLKVETIKRNERYEWAQIDSLQIRPSPYLIGEEYHHYSLVIDDKKNATKRGEPSIVLYMNGHIACSNADWEYPDDIGSIVRGVWFGSIEPLNDKYQDTWDNSVSLEGYYRDVRIWERGLSAQEVVAIFNRAKKPTLTNSHIKSSKKETASKEDEPKSMHDDADTNNNLKEESQDEDLLWADDDQLDD